MRIGLLLLLAAAVAVGESRVRIVVIRFVKHRVQVKLPRPASDPQAPLRWTTALLNAPVIEGESIRTRINSEAEVELECGSALRLAPQSAMTFNRLRLRDDGVRVTTVTVQRGEAFFTMQDADSRDFHAAIAGGVISMPDGGAKLRLDARPGKVASVTVLDGRIEVQVGGQTVAVQSSRRIAIEPGGGIQFLAMAKPDEWQKWSLGRDQAFQRAVLASGPKPPAQFGAAAPRVPILPSPTVTADGIEGLFQKLSKKHPDPYAASQGPRVPVPRCAHR